MHAFFARLPGLGPRPASAGRYSLEAVGRTHVGHVRPGNEDAFGVYDDVGIVCVADGMGGHAAGEVASALAVAAVGAAADVARAGHPTVAAERFAAAAAVAHAEIQTHERMHPATVGMGTTLTAAYLRSDGRLLVSHLGDSRAYLWREGVLEPLTADHSVVFGLVVAGLLTREQARTHPHSHSLTQCVGGGSRRPAQPDRRTVRVAAGDRLVLVTDGVTDMVPEAVLAAGLAATMPRALFADWLIAEGLARGGRDNLTMVVADVYCDAPAP